MLPTAHVERPRLRAKLAEAPRRRGVLIEPGAVFFETPPRPCPYFRLGYGSNPATQIRAGIEALQKACDTLA